MSKICDCILVIGAENSSNSVRLVEVALSHGVKSHFNETNSLVFKRI